MKEERYDSFLNSAKKKPKLMGCTWLFREDNGLTFSGKNYNLQLILTPILRLYMFTVYFRKLLLLFRFISLLQNLHFSNTY